VKVVQSIRPARHPGSLLPIGDVELTISPATLTFTSELERAADGDDFRPGEGRRGLVSMIWDGGPSVRFALVEHQVSSGPEYDGLEVAAIRVIVHEAACSARGAGQQTSSN
jgi:hypothetical protein